ncbi:MAG: mechanosensitive ion channel family protein [Planctomycetaceae bacterium]|nr:mechanosensitive ion channel family protein [Planctomycetaceae bacterium]
MDWIEHTLGLPSGIVEKLVAILIALGVYLALRWLGRWTFRRTLDDPAKRFVARKFLEGVLGIVLVIVLLRIWFERFVGIIVYLGVFSAGLAVALQKPLTNIAGWIYILWRKPFGLGDRVQIGDHAGDVIDIRLFTFTVTEIRQWVQADQATGRILHIPNGWVFEKVTCNYVQDFEYVWNELPLTITAESDWRKAKSLLTEIVNRVCPVDQDEVTQTIHHAGMAIALRQEQVQPSVWTALAPEGTTLTLRYLTNARRRRVVSTELVEAILEAFEGQDAIDIAYPTQRVFTNFVEGKSGLQPPPAPPPPTSPAERQNLSVVSSTSPQQGPQ